MLACVETHLSCPNADIKNKSDRGTWYVRKWADIYLKDAQARLAPQLKGYDLSIEDVYTLQQMCAYEVSGSATVYAASKSDTDCVASTDCGDWILEVL